MALLCISGNAFAQNVGVGENNPASKFSVNGNLAIGSGYTTTSAPSDGAIIKGELGIGISTPNSSMKLHVFGDAMIGSGTNTYNTTPAGSGALTLNGSTVGAVERFVMNDGSGTFNQYLNAYYDGSNWKYNASSQAARMTMSGGTFGFQVAASGTAGNNVSWLNGLYIDNAGNVGIGNTSPSYKFDVTGAGRFTSNVTIGAYTLPAVDGGSGYVLTTDGSGTVSWGRSGTGSIDAYVLSSGKNNAPDFSYSTATTSSNTTSGSIPDNNSTGLSRTFTISGVSTPVAHISISVKVTHPKDGDLTFTLTSPSGTTVTLTAGNGGNGANYSTVTFDDQGTTSVGNGSAPFSGTYSPNQPLAAFAGETANGTWTLKLVDGSAGSTGTFNNATLNVYAETSNFYSFVGEVAVPVTSGETVYVDGYYSAKVSGTGVALKITRSTTSGSGSVGSIIGYSASNSGSGNKYYNASVKNIDSGLSSSTYYYKMWAASTTGASGITTGTDNYQLLISKSH